MKDLQLSLFSLMKDDAKLSSDGANRSQPLANKIEGQHRPTKCKFINSSFCKKIIMKIRDKPGKVKPTTLCLLI